MDLEKLEKKIGIPFKNKDLLTEALTHRSYLNEFPRWHLPHNERLEYLGDAVLELLVSEELFAKFPDYPEGKLTVLRAALVNYQILARVAEDVGLDDFILMSRGEKKDTGKAREVILANAIEAVIGAMYLDQGLEKVRPFVQKVRDEQSGRSDEDEKLQGCEERTAGTHPGKIEDHADVPDAWTNPVRHTSACSRWASISATSSWRRARARPSRKPSSRRRRTRSKSINNGALF